MAGSIRGLMKPHHVRDVLFTAEQIQQRVDALVTAMSRDLRGDNVVMIGILRGSFIFLADLVRELWPHDIHPKIDFVTIESYGSGTESSGTARIVKELRLDVAGADVVLVDDILDTGRTLTFASNYLKERGARSVKTCALLDKPARRVVPFKADYVGFEIEDTFVVGYGLDYDSRYRELPCIAKVTFI